MCYYYYRLYAPQNILLNYKSALTHNNIENIELYSERCIICYSLLLDLLKNEKKMLTTKIVLLP